MFSFPEPKSKIDFMSHISQDIIDLCVKGKIISLREYNELRLNSYEAKYIEPYLSDEAFIAKIENCIKNVRDIGQYTIPIVYEDYLATDGIKELLKRYKIVVKGLDDIVEACKELMEAIE